MRKDLSDEAFEKLISEAMDEIPKERLDQMESLAVTFADRPSDDQRKKLNLRPNQTLFGLFEGSPRAGGLQSGQIPSRITLFKDSLVAAASGFDDLKVRVRNTLWHEVAHYFGLDHDRINEIENNSHGGSK